VKTASRWGHAAWTEEGEDPDYRFTLANERTFLAWLRTALALMAAAIAVSQLLPAFKVPGGRTVLGVVLALLGTAVALFAYAHWAATERAMRTSTPLRYSRALPLLSSALGLTGIVVLAYVAAGRS
jgi:putative membrane protein